MVTGFIQNVVAQKFAVIGKFAIHKSIRGILACTELKFAWIMPSYVKNVPYSEVENIDFTSARKLDVSIGILDSSKEETLAIPKQDYPKIATPSPVQNACAFERFF